jgi:hypothetical protein
MLAVVCVVSLLGLAAARGTSLNTQRHILNLKFHIRMIFILFIVRMNYTKDRFSNHKFNKIKPSVLPNLHSLFGCVNTKCMKAV